MDHLMADTSARLAGIRKHVATAKRIEGMPPYVDDIEFLLGEVSRLQQDNKKAWAIVEEYNQRILAAVDREAQLLGEVSRYQAMEARVRALCGADLHLGNSRALQRYSINDVLAALDERYESIDEDTNE